MAKDFERTPGAGSGDTLPIVDTTAVVKGSADDTKLVRIEADGITTGTTRVITMPDADIDLTPNNDFADKDNTITVAGTASEITSSAGAQSLAASRTWTLSLPAVQKPGVNDIWVPAAAMRPTVSNGCAALTDVETTAGRPDMTVLDFDTTADEHAQFNIVLGNRYDLGTMTFKIYWTQSVGAVTTGVAFGLQGLATSDNESLDTAYGTAVVVTDDAQGAVEEVYVSADSGAVTLGGTPADADYLSFRIFRDVSDANDDLAGDARLLGVMLTFTADQHNDA